MIASESEVISVLRKYNPWWIGKTAPDLPQWRRAGFYEISKWVENPPVKRALLLMGARQIGKTTILLQNIEELISRGIPPSNILYVSFDHPLLKLMGLEEVTKLWRSIEVKGRGEEYVFIDEIQAIKDWQVWLKYQVDFEKGRRLVVTGSATPLSSEGQESGVGRWVTVRLAPLSFYEYLQLRTGGGTLPNIQPLSSLTSLMSWSKEEFSKVAAQGDELSGLFHEYLLRGGFPQCALAPTLTLAQKLLREDIVNRVLKTDMTAFFGVRKVIELEQVFLYLCLHDGGALDISALCKDLGLRRTTVENFISLLEAAHLIYRLLPFGYGKEVLRGRPKVYLGDSAIAPAVLLKGSSLLEDDRLLGQAVEMCFFKHVFTRYYPKNMGFSYWKGTRQEEVDIVASLEGGETVPFEVKYRNQHTSWNELNGLKNFCKKYPIQRAYVITKRMDDFGIIETPNAEDKKIPTIKIPAPLACYWLSRSEIDNSKV